MPQIDSPDSIMGDKADRILSEELYLVGFVAAEYEGGFCVRWLG